MARDDTDHGLPCPGEVVPPERRTRARLSLPKDAHFDWAAAFGRDGPRVLDLGCGNGRFLIGSAIRRPDFLHLGVDLVPQAIQHAARRAGERGLENASFAWVDARRVLRHRLQPRSVRELHVYHPQPYYEKGEAHLRLLDPEFFHRAWTVLEPEGILVLQTDNPYYWRYIERAAPALFELASHPEPWPDSPEGRTRREIFARSRGLEIFRGWLVPKPLAVEAAAEAASRIPRPRFDANRPRFRRK